MSSRGSEWRQFRNSWFDLPAFFSLRVRSDQLSFMRSRRAIQSSACSCMGMPSHLFSMLASVGFEMAWVVEAVGAGASVAAMETARQPRVEGLEARTRALRNAAEVWGRRSIVKVVVEKKDVGVVGGEMGPIERAPRVELRRCSRLKLKAAFFRQLEGACVV